MQSRLHRPQGAVQGRRNLVQRGPREETELHDQAMRFRQARHRSANPLSIFSRLREKIGGACTRRHLTESTGCRKRDDVPASPSFQEPVPQNAVQPGGEPATTVEAGQGSPRFEQRLLRKILGPVGIPAENQRAAPQTRGVLLGEPLEGNRLASLGTVDQLAFVVFARVHGTGDSLLAAERFTARTVFLQISRGAPPGGRVREV